ncbi:MAG TPA: DUF4388 domain-containing protein [Gemmatimonadaceae bacterium]|nr:DUF4388 domain-containing protein [Gemmatimonadaceae bacterium]
MAIEGPLRELGIHDVFQLLDLSRKTGTLAVTSDLRDNEGTVSFESGRVVAATIRSNPHRLGELLLRSGKVTEGDIARARAAQRVSGDTRRLGEILLEMGAINSKELERQMRLQIEAVVFELLSWGEGFFRFEEGPPLEGPGAMVHISIEALLMEGARRIDEWSRIADRVPSLSAVPQLAPLQEEHASWLDLLPSEWEVLTMIDGERDLRAIAAFLARSEFDIAKIVYGLASTGVVVLNVPPAVLPRLARAITPHTASAAVAPGAGASPPSPSAATPAPVVPVTPAVLDAGDELENGFRSVRRGDFDGAVAAWTRFLRTRPNDEWSERVRGGVEAADSLRTLLEARKDD